MAWERTDESPGQSVARAESTPDGWLFHGAEVLTGPGPASCWVRVEVDKSWMTRNAEVLAFARLGERRLVLHADGDRRWFRDGVRAPQLDGCLDVDVAATPLTNTFPVRRLHDLPVGEAVTVPVAWVDVPALTVDRVDQTYHRLGRSAWEYRDPHHGPFRLTVDDHGLVLDYEGLARRVRSR
ncbi:putative glycolipid-binding domain-containing protein [Georgenia sp. SUBG003]|uniref:putative glycolipid-binding domain-containing protein n=1 Tax=Georgenia sp. SUBG003 TaxID=1497974 RepID=UPI000694A00B